MLEAIQLERSIRKRVIIQALIISLVLGILSKWEYVPGVCIGILLGLVNFYFLSREVTRIGTGSVKNPRGFLLQRFFLRYLILALGFYLSYRLLSTSIIAVFLGFLVVQVNIYFYRIFPLLKKT